MAEQANPERELQEERDAAVGKTAGGAAASGTGNILASAQRQGEEDHDGDEPGGSSAKGEDEGSASTNGEDDNLKDDQRPAY